MGLAVVLQVLPSTFAAPTAGVLNDRISRKRIMIGADVARFFIVLGMLLVRTPVMVWLVYPLLFLETIGAAFFEPAHSSVIPNIVPESQVLAANALASITWSFCLAAGASLGGIAAVWLGRDAVFVLNACSFLLSAWLIRRMRFDEPHAAGRPPLHVRELVEFTPVLEGIRYIRQEPRLFATVFVKGGIGLLGANNVLLPILGERVFPVKLAGLDHSRAALLGMSMLMGARGVGAIIGPLISGHWAGEQPLPHARRHSRRLRDRRRRLRLPRKLHFARSCHLRRGGRPRRKLHQLGLLQHAAPDLHRRPLPRPRLQRGFRHLHVDHLGQQLPRRCRDRSRRLAPHLRRRDRRSSCSSPRPHGPSPSVAPADADPDYNGPDYNRKDAIAHPPHLCCRRRICPEFPPSITSVSPGQIDAGGPGFTLLVNVSAFVQGAVVKWSGTTLSTAYVNDNTLSATVPANLIAICGKYLVTVTNAQNNPVSNSYPVIVNPALKFLSPNQLPAGTNGVTVTATGLGFSSNVYLTLLANGAQTNLTTANVNTTTLTAFIPASALNGIYPVSLFVADPTTAAVSQTLPITLTYASVTAINPTNILAGIDTFTLSVGGANFVPGAAVLWNGGPLATRYIDTTFLTATVPAALAHDAGDIGIQVKNPGAAASNSLKLVIGPNPFGSTIISLDPSSWAAGGPAVNLTVTGERFTQHVHSPMGAHSITHRLRQFHPVDRHHSRQPGRHRRRRAHHRFYSWRRQFESRQLHGEHRLARHFVHQSHFGHRRRTGLYPHREGRWFHPCF